MRSAIALGLALVACGQQNPTASNQTSSGPTGSTSSPPTVAGTPSSAAPTTTASATPMELAGKLSGYDAATLDDALKAFRLGDSGNAETPEALGLAMWMSEHAWFDDLEKRKADTSIALVLKNSDAERGKVMCVSGEVVYITTLHASIAGRDVSDLTTGVLNDGPLGVRFVAARSTGKIVVNTQGKMCGVIAGKSVYKNSTNGTARTAYVVGMFDLPENHQR